MEFSLDQFDKTSLNFAISEWFAFRPILKLDSIVSLCQGFAQLDFNAMGQFPLCWRVAKFDNHSTLVAAICVST
jgi:hypothetical protein